MKPPKTALCQQAATTTQGMQLISHVSSASKLAESTEPALIIDAILGCGQRGALGAEVVEALDHLRQYDCPALAIDVPTGIHGPHLLPKIKTLCLQIAKSELFTNQHLGEFKTVDIGIPQAAYTDVHPSVMRLFPPLKQHGHKGQHGECLIIGGGVFPGALHFASSAALITGCDQVRAVTSDGPPLPPSIIQHRIPGRYLSSIDPDMISSLLLRAGSILIGPGLGREPGTSDMAQQVFHLAYDMGIPIIIDADGISALSNQLQHLPPGQTPVIITPHQGEARTLLGHAMSPQAIHQFARPDRLIVLKGTTDLITNGGAGNETLAAIHA